MNAGNPDQNKNKNRLVLVDGSRVGVIGGGPAGSFFSYYLLDMAQKIGIDLQIDILEPRDFTRPGPVGCNMCGGIISESLVQMLAADGINLPANVVQRGLDSYMLHTDVGSVRIESPNLEKRIGAVHRGPGPRDINEMTWASFDGHLQSLTTGLGANLINTRVTGVRIENGFPVVETRTSEDQVYDLLAVATGVNSPTLKLFEKLDFGYQAPGITKTFICEYFFGNERINQVMGNSMHVFLLNIPRLKFAAIIPKGDYVTICLLGKEIDSDLVNTFLNAPEVVKSMPPEWEAAPKSCNCSPRMNIEAASHPFADRIVFIGDCGVSRLYKDGIGAAYRTAKAAASTAIFQGISDADFEKYFWPTCKEIINDNSIGKLSFMMTTLVQNMKLARKGLVRMTKNEQEKNNAKRMSMVMWDMFTGSASYKEIFLRTLHPAFLLQFIKNVILANLARP